MKEDEVIQILHEYFESLFPKVCQNCNRWYNTLKEYIQNTERLGRTISYDAEKGDWQTSTPIGSFAYANCSCGNTLVLSTDHLATPLRMELLGWVKNETGQRGLSPSQLLDYLRDRIRERALEDSEEDPEQ